MDRTFFNNLAGFLAAVAAAFAVRALSIDHPVLWLDELFTIIYAREDISHLLSLVRTSDVHPPGYYLVVKGVVALFGEGDGTGLRLISVMAAALSAGVFFLFVRHRFGLGVAVVAALFFALLPVNVHFARELRTYALVALTLLIAIVCYLEMTVPRRPTRERRLYAMGYIASLAISFHLHYSAIVYFALFGGSALGIWLLDRDPGKLRFTLAATIAAGLLCLPQAVHFVWARSHVSDGFWIAKTDLRVLYTVSLGAYPFPAWAKPVVYSVYLAGAWILWRKDRHVAVIAFTFLVGGPVLVALIGLLTPAYLVRTIQAFTVLSPLLIALVICALPRIAAFPAAAALVAVHVLTLLPEYPAEKQSLQVDEIMPVLAEFEPEEIYYQELLAIQLDVRRISRAGWKAVNLEEIAVLKEIERRVRSCVAGSNCGPTAIIMERSPRFDKENGRIWMEGMDSLAAAYDTNLDKDVSGLRVLVIR